MLWLTPLILLVTISCVVRASETEELKILLDRVNRLEESDASHKAEIAGLTTKFTAEINDLKSEIENLRQTCSQHRYDSNTHSMGTKRAVSPTQIAFSAIAPDFDFSVMRADQKLIYAPPFTNIGNAFDHASGTFTAPVKGTYLFFVTVGGNIHSSNYFYVDVNGVTMGKVLLSTVPNQSSNMVVVTLRPGDPVSVKSGKDNDGAYGGHYTTFSGFLLYEHTPGAVVGR